MFVWDSNYHPHFTKEFVGSVRRFRYLIQDHLAQIPSYGTPGFHVGTGMSMVLPLSLLVFWYTYPCSLSLISSLFLMATFNTILVVLVLVLLLYLYISYNFYFHTSFGAVSLAFNSKFDDCSRLQEENHAALSSIL